MPSQAGRARTFTSRKRTVEAVREVDLTVADGEIVGFLGPNGAGKTTTLRMLTTLLRPTAGAATVAGADLLADPVGVRRRIGYVAQAIGALAPAINMVVVPLMLLSGIMLPMTLGPGWLQGIARATPFRYIIDAMRGAFAGHYLTTSMLEGILVALGLAVACLWIAGRAFVRENA